nr:hypothetical protein [Tanacetum cinerariifolium]
TSAPVELQLKKRKQATETSDKPPKAKKSKYGWVSKKRSLKHVATSEAEDVPVMEPWVAAEDAELQKVLEESMKIAYATAPQGPLPPVVIREPESGKYQPLSEVPGKGKAKVSEEQAGPDPGNAGDEEQSILSPVVHAGSDCEHMDLDADDVSPQPSTEQLDEGFTATAYLKVQESLKLADEEHVLLEEPASSSGTLYSLQHLSKDISFGDLFFSDRPSDANKNAETEVESMVNVPIQQAIATTTDITTTTTTTTLPPPQAPQQSNTEAMMIQRIGELEHIMANLIQVNKDMEERLDKHGPRLYTLEQLDIPQQADMKDILHQRMWETESYKTHEDHTQLFEALEKSMNHDHSEELAQDLAEAPGPSGPSGAPGASRSSQVPPPPPIPPPPLSTSQESPSKGSAVASPSKTAASAEYQAWTTTDVRLMPSISLTPADLEMDEDMGP